jgi:signal transduction histidine kinase
MSIKVPRTGKELIVLISKRYISVGFSNAKLKERNKNLSLLINFNDFISACMTPKEVLEAAVSRVIEHFDFKAGRMYLMDKSGESLSLAASEGVDTMGLEHVGIMEGFTGKAARTRSFIAQHVSELEDRQRAAILLSKGFKVVVCVPLIHGDKVLGVMNLGADRIIRLSKARIDLLVAVGNAIAVALEHSRLCEELEMNVRELKEKNETIEFFTYTASHDIRSPLVGIYGLARLLGRQYGERLDERGKSYCNQILKTSEQVLTLVEGINTYVKSKEALLHLENVRIGEIVESVRLEFAEALNRRHIRWLVDDPLPEIMADKLGMERIFRNLVENALKYGGENLSEIRIGYERSPAVHILYVADDGVGIKSEAEKLFRPFYRHKTSAGTEGTGLGLAIVKEIAVRHKGEAWIDQGTIKGATFRFSISKDLGSRS